MNIKIKFKGPKIISKQIIDNKLILKLSWGMLGKGTSIIEKTNNGYTHKDVGFFKREFSTIEYLLWEFELPQELSVDIESLKPNSN
jgi:hypothetical protein